MAIATSALQTKVMQRYFVLSMQGLRFVLRNVDAKKKKVLFVISVKKKIASTNLPFRESATIKRATKIADYGHDPSFFRLQASSITYQLRKVRGESRVKGQPRR